MVSKTAYAQPAKVQRAEFRVNVDLSLNNKRLAELDSLRGLAALSVFFSHFLGAFTLQSKWFKIVSQSPIRVLWDGAGAVTLFFLLSGFVLSLPFIKGNKTFDLIPFYIKRVFRIYPALLCAIVLSLCLQHYLFNAATMQPFSEWLKGFWNWKLNSINIKAIINTFLLIGPTFDDKLIVPVLWSLVIEMKISLLLPFFIIIASRTNFFFNILFLFASVYFTANSTLGIFYFGILLAKYKDTLVGWMKSLESSWIILFSCAIAIFLYSCVYTFQLEQSKILTVWYISMLLNYIQVAGCAIFILLILSREKVNNYLRKKVFLLLGEVSYSFYLVHFPVLLVTCSLFSNASGVNPFLILTTSLAVSLAISYLMYRIVERPFQEFAKKLVKKLRFINFIKF